MENEAKGGGAAFTEQGLCSIGEVVLPLLAPDLSAAFVAGMTGGTIRAPGESPTFTDLQALLIPGLASLGVHAELAPLPEEDVALQRQLHERLRRGIPIPVFAFAITKSTDALSESRMVTDNTDDTDKVSSVRPSGSTPSDSALFVTERQEKGYDPCLSVSSVIQTEFGPMTRQGLVVRIEAESGPVVWREADGEEKQADLEGLRAAFSHLLRVRREARKGGRRGGVQAALLRWLAFADAFPERVLSADAENAYQRKEAAAFLGEVAGKKRDPVAIRLRRAAARFAEAQSPGDVQDALYRLREAVLLDLRLPAVAQKALLSPATEPLSDIARRELIYLARAGTRDIKVLAARRLQPERHHADARSTLEQLAYDPDAWVRAIVRT